MDIIDFESTLRSGQSTTGKSQLQKQKQHHSGAARRAAMPHNNPSPFRPFTPANNMKRKASSGHKAGSMAALLSSVCDEQ
jgi:hypothetical protein